MRMNVDLANGLFATARIRVQLLTLVLACLCAASSSWAQTASSEGYGASIDLDLNLLGIGSDQAVLPATPDVSGQGGTSYGPFEDSVTGPDMNILTAVEISTGILSGAASYDASERLVSGFGAVEQAEISALLPSLPDLLVSADSLHSDTQISGTCGNLQITAGSTIVNGQLVIDGESMGLSENPPPNSIIDLGGIGFAGVTVIMNEQQVTGDGLHDLQVTTHAMRIIFTVDVLLAQLTGEIMLGSSSAAIEGCASANIAINQIAAPDPATAGEALTYTLMVSNSGPDAASDVQVLDVFPGSLVIDSITADPAMDCGLAGQQLNCSIATLASGASVDVVIVTAPDAAGTVVNTATLTQSADDPDPSDNSSTISVEVNPAPPAGADLEMALASSDNTVTVGQTLSYTIDVSNAGPDAADDYQVQMQVPSQLSIQAINPEPGVNCNQAGSQVNCSGTLLAAGASVSMVIDAIATDTGSAVVTAMVSHAGQDPDPANNQAAVITQVNPAPVDSADLGLMLSASNSVITIGETLIYTIQVSNAGPDAAADYMINDLIPSQLSIQSVSTSGGTSCLQTAQQVTCGGESLAPGASATVTINTLAIAEGTVVNSADVTQDTADPDSGNNQASVSTQINPAPQPQADLQVVFSPPPPATVERGQLHDVLIVMSNNGPDTAEQVVLQVDIPMTGNAEQVFTDADLQCSVTEFQVICQGANFGSGASADVRVIVELDIPGEDQVFSAQVSAVTADPDTANNQESHAVDVTEAKTR